VKLHAGVVSVVLVLIDLWLLPVQAKNALLYCGVPLYGVVWYCADYREKEKQHHRY